MMDGIRSISPSRLVRAEARLSEFEQQAAARGDEATISVVACARAVEKSVPETPEARLRIAETAARAIESASISTVGLQAQAAKGMLDAVDDAWPTLSARREGARQAVIALADRAVETHAPEARNARFLADIAKVVESPENVLSTMQKLEPADVDRLDWYVATARSGALEGVSTVGERARGARVVKLGLDEIRRNGGHPHLDRMEALQDKLQSPRSRLMVRYHTLEMIEDQVPAGPEAGLVLAHKVGRWGGVPAEDKAAVRQAAVDEALPTATGELRRWLEFHEASKGLANADQLHDVMLYCCVLWGAPPEPRYLDFALFKTLRETPPEPESVAQVWRALDTLTGPSEWRDSVERYLELADRCEKGAPEWRLPMLEHALEGARTATEPAARVMLGMLDGAPPQGTDRTEHLKQGLSRMLNVGRDRMQDALTGSVSDDVRAPGGITTGDDYVMIGGLRVPRRAIH